MKIALATSAELPVLFPGEHLLLPALQAKHAHADICVWDDAQINWRQYDAVVLRCTWDYHEKLPAFLAWLDHLQAQDVQVINDLETLRWNLNKHYLLELAAKGLSVIPTQVITPEDKRPLANIMRELNWPELVLKPVQSAAAWRTLRVQQHNIEAAQTRFDQWRIEQDYLLQPFMPEIIAEGEWSLIFFNGQFSHALLKRAKAGDFRVQSDHGGSVHEQIAPAFLRDQAQTIIAALPHMPCYARVDGIVRDQQFLLMELELLEPELFLALSPAAPGMFADAIMAALR